MNVSDSIQGKGSLYGYNQGANGAKNARTTNKASQNSTTGSTSRADKLAALKAKMQSGAPVDLNSLADSMLKKGAFIDLQA